MPPYCVVSANEPVYTSSCPRTSWGLNSQSARLGGCAVAREQVSRQSVANMGPFAEKSPWDPAARTRPGGHTPRGEVHSAAEYSNVSFRHKRGFLCRRHEPPAVP